MKHYFHLDKKYLHLVVIPSTEQVVFEYEGKVVAELMDSGSVKFFEKLPRGYKSHIIETIDNLMTGRSKIFHARQ